MNKNEEILKAFQIVKEALEPLAREAEEKWAPIAREIYGYIGYPDTPYDHFTIEGDNFVFYNDEARWDIFTSQDENFLVPLLTLTDFDAAVEKAKWERDKSVHQANKDRMIKLTQELSSLISTLNKDFK